MSTYGVIPGPYFLAFGLNAERCEVSLCIQFECGKLQTRNYSVFGQFSRSVKFTTLAGLFKIEVFVRGKSVIHGML